MMSQNESMHFAAALVEEPPQPPRELTPQAAGRVWLSRGVRVFSTATIAFMLLALALFIAAFFQWYHDTDLVRNGQQITANVHKIFANHTITQEGQGAESTHQMQFKFEHEGREVIVRGYLIGRTGFVKIGDEVALRIDPSDPKRWTSALEAESILGRMIGVYVAMPIVIVLVICTMVARWRAVSLWKHGQAVPALVEKVKQSVIAPGCDLVACSLIDDKDRRLRSVLMPRSKVELQPGDELWLIVPRSGMRALPAALFM